MWDSTPAGAVFVTHMRAKQWDDFRNSKLMKTFVFRRTIFIKYNRKLRSAEFDYIFHVKKTTKMI